MSNRVVVGLVIIVAVVSLIAIATILIHSRKKRKEIIFSDLKKKSLISDFSIIKEKSKYVEIIYPYGSSFDFKDNINFISEKFGRNFINCEYIIPTGLFSDFKKPKVRLKDANFPKEAFSYPAEIKLKPDEIYYGYFEDQKNLILPVDLTSSILIEGQTRAGKTSLVNTIILSFVEKNDNYQIIIIDTKNSFSKLKSKKNVKVYDPKELDELQQIQEELESIAQQIESNKYLLDLVDNSLEEIRAKQEISLPRTLIICEEAYEWLYLDRSEKEEYPLKQDIMKNLKTFITKGRAFSSLTIFATQAQHSDQLPFKENLFPTKIFSQTTESLSREKIGSDMLATDSLKNGRFYILNPFKKGFFQAPLVTKNDLLERLK